MQRCPTCDFVYEEGQRYCDMDGTVLVHDPNELPRNKPFPHTRVRPFFRLLAIVVIPNTLLLALLFYGTSQPAAQSYVQASEAVKVASERTTPTDEPAVKESDASTITKELSESKVTVQAEPSSEGSSLSEKTEASRDSEDLSLSNSSEPHKPNAAGKPANAKRGPAPKPDSKIGSFIKKTGRILKKPFKF